MQELWNSLYSLEMEDGLKDLGFTGFYAVQQLRAYAEPVPTESGIYLVIDRGRNPPKFKKPEPGGYFKGKDSNVSIDTLKVGWVEGALILYVGKSDKLQIRIKQLINAGNDKNVTHDGGRLLSQLENEEYLEVCWKTVQNEKQEETKMLEAFKQVHGKLPFANLQG